MELSLIKEKYHKLITSRIYGETSRFLFWVGFACVLCSDTFYHTFFQNIVSGGAVYKLGLLCLTGKITLDILGGHLSDNKLIKLLQILAVISAYGTFLTTRYLAIMSLFLILVAANNMNYSHIIKFFLVVICITYIINIVLVSTGLKLEDIWIDDNIGHDGSTRHFIGYWHPNAAMTMTANVFLCLVVYFKEKYKAIICVVMTLIASIVFYYTDSRSGFIVFVVSLLLISISKTRFAQCLLRMRFSFVAFLTSLIGMFGLSIYMDGKTIFNNRFLSTFESRLVSLGYFKNELEFSLLGRNLSDYVLIDCAYFKLLFYFGVIPFLVFIVTYLISIYRKKDDYYFGVYIVAISLILLYNTYPLHVYYALPFIAAFSSMRQEERKDEIIAKYKKCVNGAFAFAIILLLIGHGIVQYGMEQEAMYGVTYWGPRNPYVTDSVFTIIGAIVGVVLVKYASKKSQSRLEA